MRSFKNIFRLMLLILVLQGCGQDKGKKNVVPPGVGTTNLGNPYTPANFRGIIGSVRSKISCKPMQANWQTTFQTNGPMNMISFMSQSNYQGSGYYTGNQTQVTGTFTNGSLPGNVANIYVGESAFGDLIFISKITNGSQVIGYNVDLSFCSQYAITQQTYNPYGGYQTASTGSNLMPLIANERPMTNFSANGIVIVDDTSCPHGKVSFANTMTMSQPIQWQGISLQAFPVQTTYTLVNCY